MTLEHLLAGAFFVFGLVSAGRSLARAPHADEDGRVRLLIAVHDSARALFWLALGAFFLAYGLAPGIPGVRWLLLIPIAMAALRLVAASFLART